MVPSHIAPSPRAWYSGAAMNTPIDIPFRTRGRASKPLHFTEVRALDAGDLVLLQEERGAKPPPLKRLADRHHAIARCLASGMSESDTAIACGLSSSRVSILKNDPAFKELLQFYRDETNAQYRDLHERLAGISMDATALLQEQLEADLQADMDNRKLSTGALMQLTQMGADRTGHGPQSSQNVNVNVNLASRLQAARERVAARNTLIEGD